MGKRSTIHPRFLHRDEFGNVDFIDEAAERAHDRAVCELELADLAAESSADLDLHTELRDR